MKEKYFDLMEQALSAYSDEHIFRYFGEVKEKGLTEHGFPRLTSNMGILIAHGRRLDLLPVFLEMMDFCCNTIPKVKAANDFSVREILCCLWEIEKNGVVHKERTEEWRRALSTIDPLTCYNCFATSPTDSVRNWALFTAVSEYFRQTAGLCDSSEFIELQVLQQLQWLDENGMYMDNPHADNHQPIMYDLVPRGLFVLLLDQGYRGRSYAAIDGILKKAALLTLEMQSSNGEMAFGGRSNQFLHNEAWMIVIYEYEAKRYAREGNHALARRFKAASARALAVTEGWLSKTPILHIKNRFPTETQYGCEHYAYFDKYMITAASNLYAAYSVCDDTIHEVTEPDHAPAVFQTSPHFHKVFLKSGGYALEFDTDADPKYDASGLGRIHREGAPSTICLSVPCPSQPKYTVDLENPVALSLCAGIPGDGAWRFATDESVRYEVKTLSKDGDAAVATILCRFSEENTVTTRYRVSADGVEIEVEGDGELAYLLPAFCFDGEKTPRIDAEEHTLAVSYEGWICRYTTDGLILDQDQIAANRNGHYRAYAATERNQLRITVQIMKR